MEKTLVCIHVPSIGLVTDAFIPEGINVASLVSLLIETVEQASRGFYKSSGNEVVCIERLGITLNPTVSLQKYKLENGDRLVLI